MIPPYGKECCNICSIPVHDHRFFWFLNSPSYLEDVNYGEWRPGNFYSPGPETELKPLWVEPGISRTAYKKHDEVIVIVHEGSLSGIWIPCQVIRQEYPDNSTSFKWLCRKDIENKGTEDFLLAIGH